MPSTVCPFIPAGLGSASFDFGMPHGINETACLGRLTPRNLSMKLSMLHKANRSLYLLIRALTPKDLSATMGDCSTMIISDLRLVIVAKEPYELLSVAISPYNCCAAITRRLLLLAPFSC